MDAVVVIDGQWTTTKALKEAQAYQRRKRYRATAVVIQNDKVLLVKDKGKDDWSMPGGGFNHGESTIQACIREVTKEELGRLTVVSAERLRQCNFKGTRAKHKVAKLIVEGKAYVKDKHELQNKILWWDMKGKIKAQGHVYCILNKMGMYSHEHPQAQA